MRRVAHQLLWDPGNDFAVWLQLTGQQLFEFHPFNMTSACETQETGVPSHLQVRMGNRDKVFF